MDWRCQLRTCIPRCNPVAAFSDCRKATPWTRKLHTRGPHRTMARPKTQWSETRSVGSTSSAEGWPSMLQARKWWAESELAETLLVPTRVRNNLGLDHLSGVRGVSGDAAHPDNIIFDITANPNGGTGI